MKPVAILGAGLTGLSCAHYLHRAGVDFLLFDSNNHVGGRVSSKRTNSGFLIDEGFQVLLTSYPETRQLLDLETLELNSFRSGALIFNGKNMELLANPLSYPQGAFKTLKYSHASLKDKVLVLKLLIKSQGSHSDLPLGKQTTMAFLKEWGFSSSFIENFWRPFLNGVYLDPELTIGSDFFLFLVKCFGWGRVALPKRGIAALPEQLAQQLPQDKINLGVEVKSWSHHEIVTARGETFSVSHVVCTFNPKDFTESFNPENHRSVITYYFTSPRLKSLPWQRWLILVPPHLGLNISHMALLTSVSPSYSANGKELLSVSVVGSKEPALETVIQEVELIAQRPLELELVSTTKVPRALPRIEKDFPGFQCRDGIYYGGDYLSSPSVQGALKSGRLVAQELIKLRT